MGIFLIYAFLVYAPFLRNRTRAYGKRLVYGLCKHTSLEIDPFKV